MAIKEYVGAVALEIDGRDYEVIDYEVRHNSGKKLVKTMNRKGKALGYCQGVATYEIHLTAAIPVDDPMDWDSFEGAKFTITPVSGNGTRTSFIDCISMEDSQKFDAENEARVSVTILALDRIQE